MFIKDQIKIAGHTFDVEQINNLADSGSTDTSFNKILIKADLCKEQQESTLIHECIEAVNSIYDLNLNHQTIQTLEAAFYQIIKDNFFKL